VTTKLVQWQSTLAPRPDEETCIKAFVKLVAHIGVLEDGEAYCIQNHSSTAGSGFILAHAGQDKFDYVEYNTASAEIPTDFSVGDSNFIGTPKVSFSVLHRGRSV
jgi:ferricrocin synthase